MLRKEWFVNERIQFVKLTHLNCSNIFRKPPKNSDLGGSLVLIYDSHKTMFLIRILGNRFVTFMQHYLMHTMAARAINLSSLVVAYLAPSMNMTKLWQIDGFRLRKSEGYKTLHSVLSHVRTKYQMSGWLVPRYKKAIKYC